MVADEILFDPTVFNTPQTITLTQGELVITEAVTIDGAGAKHHHRRLGE